MPRSFLVKKKMTKCKDEKTPSDGEDEVRADAVVQDSKDSVPATTTSASAVLQNVAETIAGEARPLHSADSADHQTRLQMSPADHLLSFAGEYATYFTLFKLIGVLVYYLRLVFLFYLHVYQQLIQQLITRQQNFGKFVYSEVRLKYIKRRQF